MARPPKKPDDAFERIAAGLPEFEDDALAMASLRVMAARDPPMGAPMNVARPGEPDNFIEPGGWMFASFVDHRTGLPPNCPVTPLGKLGDQFFFLNTLGEVHILGPASGKGHWDALFAGRPLYLCWAWPRWQAAKTKTASPKVTNFEAELTRQALFAACAFKGTFELEDRVRGRGAWTDDDGSLIYHAGDAVWIGGGWRAPGEHGRFIYPGRPKVGRPSPNYEPAGEGSPGDIVLQALMSWNWDRGELDARLALGWLMMAKVGGAIAQRPIVYVVGTEGAGKSTFQKLFRLLMNGALVATSNTTQAGVYQQVKQDSVAVLVDELEDKEDTRTTGRILELARIAYSGDKMNRGGKEGTGQQFACVSSFLFSSIAAPAMGAQDASRMAMLMMRERIKGKLDEKPVNVLAELGLTRAATCELVGRQLLRRAFKWFELDGGRSRWDRLLEAMRETLVAVGHEDRSADTFGYLAAGCHIALRDDMPDAAELAQWGAWLRADQLAETAGRQRTWQRAFFYLLEATPEALRHNSHHKSLGSAIEAFERQPRGRQDRSGHGRASLRRGDQLPQAVRRAAVDRQRAVVRAVFQPELAQPLRRHGLGRRGRRAWPVGRGAQADAARVVHGLDQRQGPEQGAARPDDRPGQGARRPASRRSGRGSHQRKGSPMRFVWLDNGEGESVPINPDQVATLAKSVKRGATRVIFGAVTGGSFEVTVRGTLQEVAALLQSGAKGDRSRPDPA